MTCAKQLVTATVVALDGRRFVGTNACAKPQVVCPRAGMPTGEGYELCTSVCEQQGHAEVQALRAAGPAAVGATVYLQGHDYGCNSCIAALRDAGVAGLVIGPPPDDGWVEPGTFGLGTTVDIMLADGSVLCGCIPQSDGDLWWGGSGTGERFIDPVYTSVLKCRVSQNV